MTTRIVYEAMPLGCRDFAMPVQETVSDWYDYCPSCEASVNETDYEAGACTQCGYQITTEEGDDK